MERAPSEEGPLEGRKDFWDSLTSTTGMIPHAVAVVNSCPTSCEVAPGPGFEPGPAGSEPAVLPLNDPGTDTKAEGYTAASGSCVEPQHQLLRLLVG